MKDEPKNHHQDMEFLLIQIIRSIRTAILYGIEHASSLRAYDFAFRWLEKMLVDQGKIQVGIIDEKFVVNDRPLYALSKKQGRLISDLTRNGIERLEFRTGVSKPEFLGFISTIAHVLYTNTDTGYIDSQFEQKDIQHIKVGRINLESSHESHPSGQARIPESVKESYQYGLEFLKNTVNDINEGRALNMYTLKHVTASLIKNVIKHKDLLLMLTSIKMNSADKFTHNLNVSILTIMQTRVLGLEDKYLEHIGQAALLHNIGELCNEEGAVKWKDDSGIGIPEYAVRGAKMLIETESITPLSAIVAFEHSLPWEERGYPKYLYGEQFNLVSLMIAIAKSYDTMRQESKQNNACRPEVIYSNMMNESGLKYHPDLLNNFFFNLGVYPPGTLVLLDNDEIAFVIEQSMIDMKRPMVEILYDASGRRIESPNIINLQERNNRGEYKKTIVRSILDSDGVEMDESQVQ